MQFFQEVAIGAITMFLIMFILSKFLKRIPDLITEEDFKRMEAQRKLNEQRPPVVTDTSIIVMEEVAGGGMMTNEVILDDPNGILPQQTETRLEEDKSEPETFGEDEKN